MSKISKQVDQQQQSDSDLSLQLSDASSLSSDSDLSDSNNTPVKKKPSVKKKPVKKSNKKTTNKKKKVKDDTLYCTCRKGYDGKEFMIECDGCKEWFHGACVGLKPNSVTDHYFCKSCLSKTKPAGKTLIPPPRSASPPRKKSIIILPISKPEPTPAPVIIPVISKLSIDDDEDEDLDDICPVCDGDCTCGTADDIVTSTPLPPPPAPKPAPKPTLPEPPKKIGIPKVVIKKTIPAASKSKKPKKSTVVKDDISDDISDNSSSDSDSGSSDSDSGSSDSESDSEDDDTVVERIGVDTKKKPSTPVRRGKSTTLLANIIRQMAPFASKGKGKGGKKMNYISSSTTAAAVSSAEEEDSDEEVVVDDLDDLLETMSPLSEHSSNESDNSLLESEEFFTDDDEDDVDDVDDLDIDSSNSVMSPYPDSRASYSSVHIDSGDDEDIENAETQAIIAEMTLDSDEEDIESDLDEGMFVEDEEDDDEEGNTSALGYYVSNKWSDSSDDEDEEEEEFDYTTALPSEDDNNNFDMDDSDEDRHNPLLPLLDSEGNLYDSIAAAFMQALAPISEIQQHQGDTTTGANTPALGEEYQLSAFELAHALSALSAETSRQQHNQDFLRRPSLPSSAVSAAQRNRGSQDFTSEALRALSALVSDDLSLALEPIHENERQDMSDDVESTTKDNTPTQSSPSPINTSIAITTDQPLDVTRTTTPSPTTTPTTEHNDISSILPNHLALSLSTDLKLQEQILDILKGTSSMVESSTVDKLPITTTTITTTNSNTNNSPTSSNKKPSISSIYSPNSSRQILPKPSGSASSSSSFFPNTALTTSALEQQIQDAINQTIENNKRKGTSSSDVNSKKRRISRSNSLTTAVNHLQPMETTSFSTPASPAAIIDELEDMNIQIDDDDEEEGDDEEAMAVSMDDLVDTSQLYTRSLSRSPSPEVEDDNPYSRDLSRWQRIPIGAFRLMRSKNKLWLER